MSSDSTTNVVLDPGAAHQGPRSYELVLQRITRSFGRAAPYFLAGVFLLAALSKAVAPQRFAETTASIRVIPMEVRWHLPLMVPLLELAVAALMLLPWARRCGLYAAAFSLVGFTGFLMWAVFDPSIADCNCFGPITDRFVAGGSERVGLVRNVILLGVAVAGINSVNRPHQPGVA